MQKKIVLAISMIFTAMLLLSVLPINAWVYPDCSEDDTYEKFGPRLDQILIKFYDGDTPEFMALEGHEIDITDWTLTHEWKMKLCTPPESDYIKCVSYGPDYGMNVLDINNNATIEYQDFMPCVTREPAMRRAIAYLCDKDRMVDECAGGQGFPMYALLGPGWTKYAHPEIVPGGLLEDLCYLYSCDDARATLAGDPNFQFVAGPATCEDASGPCTGSVVSDYGDHLQWYVEEHDAWEPVCLKFFIRSDDPERFCAGNMVAYELEHCLGVCLEITYGDSDAAKLKVMANKDFHLYTGGWGLSYDPDWPWYLYSIDWYWHPGRPLNYDHVNCSDFEYWSYILATANTQEEAVEAAHRSQEAMAAPDCVGCVPLWEAEGMKPYRKTYLGTPGVPDEEDQWEGMPWEGVVNEMGFGINSWYTFLNMRPDGTILGDCEHMTVRYGFRVPELLAMNPMYSEWLYDYNVLGFIYDSLLTVNPYDLSDWQGYIAECWETGTYNDLGYESMYVDFFLRPDVYWSDGEPFTTADVEFSLHSCEELLDAKGCPPPWFSQTTWAVHNVTIYDEYTCRVYLVEKSMWALHSVGGSIMIPKHIWEPLILGPATCEDLQGWGPDLDPDLVGTGPYKWTGDYVPENYCRLEKYPGYFRRYAVVTSGGPSESWVWLTDKAHFCNCTNQGPNPYYHCTCSNHGVPYTCNAICPQPTTQPPYSYSLKGSTKIQVNMWLDKYIVGPVDVTVTVSVHLGDQTTLPNCPPCTWLTAVHTGTLTADETYVSLPIDLSECGAERCHIIHVDNITVDIAVAGPYSVYHTKSYQVTEWQYEEEWHYCPGDFNGDGIVDGSDFFILLISWGSGTGDPFTAYSDPRYDPRADANCDGIIDGSDFFVLLQNWGAVCIV